MSANLSSSPFSLQVTSSLWDSSDVSGHSGELCLVDALRVLLFFWFLVGGCLVLACLDPVLHLALDPRQPQESGLSVACDNLEHSLVASCSGGLQQHNRESSRRLGLFSVVLYPGAVTIWCLLGCGWCYVFSGRLLLLS